MIKNKRPMTACHDQFEHTDSAGFTFRTTYCGKRSVSDSPSYKMSDKEQERLDNHIKRNTGRPLQHCKRCIKAKTKEQPDYVPPVLGFYNED